MARFTRGSDVQPVLPGAPAATPARRSDSGPKPFPNKFGARCTVCTVWVEAGEGETTKVDGKWQVRHVQPCPTPGQAPAQADTKPVERGSFSVPDGRYTVIWENHYKTIRVTTQDQFADFMPGRPVLSYLSGANNDRDYTRFAHVDEHGNVRIWKKHQANETLREAVKVLVGDPKAASKAYAQESGECGVCGRTLTTPESLAAGIGPECARRLGW